MFVKKTSLSMFSTSLPYTCLVLKDKSLQTRRKNYIETCPTLFGRDIILDELGNIMDIFALRLCGAFIKMLATMKKIINENEIFNTYHFTLWNKSNICTG